MSLRFASHGLLYQDKHVQYVSSSRYYSLVISDWCYRNRFRRLNNRICHTVKVQCPEKNLACTVVAHHQPSPNGTSVKEFSVGSLSFYVTQAVLILSKMLLLRLVPTAMLHPYPNGQTMTATQTIFPWLRSPSNSSVEADSAVRTTVSTKAIRVLLGLALPDVL